MKRILCGFAALALCLAVTGNANAALEYVIDNGQAGGQFNNTLGSESSPNQAEDNWVGNTFTSVAGGTHITGVSWLVGIQLGNLPSGTTITAAGYLGSPATTLTYVPGTTVSEPVTSLTENTWASLQFASPMIVPVGQQFTVALLIDNVPGTPFGSAAFPFTNDNSGSNTNSWFDVSSAGPGNVNAYDLANPFSPTLNGNNYAPYGGTNTNVDITMLRANTPEPSSLAVWGLGVAAVFFVSRRRRSA